MSWFGRSDDSTPHNQAERILVSRDDWDNMRDIFLAFCEIMKHPEARAMLLSARKLANPRVFIPEIDGAPWGFGPPRGPFPP